MGKPAWEALRGIADYLASKGGAFEIRGEISDRAHVGENVFIGEGTTVAPNAVILGPAWIGKNCTIRPGAYIRQNVIAGDGCVLGNSSEFKNCLLFDRCEVPHFNYVGDSILGHRAHLGAGVILSNVRLDRENVRVPMPDGTFFDTGLRKFGAVVGDFSEIGCNSVLSPGSVVGARTILYPGTQWRGVLAEDRIVKLIQEQQIVERR